MIYRPFWKKCRLETVRFALSKFGSVSIRLAVMEASDLNLISCSDEEMTALL
jgi:hypothetical protein